MLLAQDDKVVHTLAPDRSDQPFGKAILPRRGRRYRLVPDERHNVEHYRKLLTVEIDPTNVTAWT